MMYRYAYTMSNTYRWYASFIVSNNVLQDGRGLARGKKASGTSRKVWLRLMAASDEIEKSENEKKRMYAMQMTSGYDWYCASNAAEALKSLILSFLLGACFRKALYIWVYAYNVEDCYHRF